MKIIKYFMIVFLFSTISKTMSSELEQSQIQFDESKRQEGRDNLLACYQRRCPKSNFLGSRLTLENQNKQLKYVLDMLNLFILQDQDWENFSQKKLDIMLSKVDKSSPVWPLADLFLRVWYFNKFNKEVCDKLYKEDRIALKDIGLNRRGALILSTRKFRYRMDMTSGEYSIFSDGNIINSGKMEKELVNRVAEVLFRKAKIRQTRGQLELATIIIALIIYVVWQSV
jgi:hypothetical protein